MDPREIVFVDAGRELEAGVQGQLGQALAAIAVLADLQVHDRQASGQRRLDSEVVELAASDGQALLQAGHLRMDLRQLLATQSLLTLVGLQLQRPQCAVVAQFVGDLVGFLARRIADPRQRRPARGHSSEAQHIVLDGFERLLVGGAVLLQLALVRLQLSDGFHQPTLLIQDFEFELGVAKHDQRLARGDPVAGLDQQLLHLAALKGVEIDGVPGGDLALQARDVVEHAGMNGLNGDARQRNPGAAFGRT